MYYHGVINGLVKEKILSILKDREINSARSRNINNKIGFNGIDYISICCYFGQDIYNKYHNNAFNKYV